MIFNSNEGEGISSFTVYAIDYDLIGVKNLIYGKPKDNNLDNYKMENCEVIKAEL